MGFDITTLLIGLAVGFFIAWIIFSLFKKEERTEILNERWKRRIAEQEREYELRIEKLNSALEKPREENKTNIEKVAKELQIKHINELGTLRGLFKESEKRIKQKSVSSSRRSLVGKFIEKFIPFLSKVKYEPSDMHFIGQPVDYIVFEGLHEDKINKVTFLEVKTGESKLTKREKSLKETIQKKKVYWNELRIDTTDKSTPDKEIGVEDSCIDEIYDEIDSKISSARQAVSTAKVVDSDEEDLEEDALEVDVVCPHCEAEVTVRFSGDEVRKMKAGKEISVECSECEQTFTTDESILEDEEEEDEPGEYEIVCPKCGETYSIEADEDDDFKKGVKIECPFCQKTSTIHEEDL